MFLTLDILKRHDIEEEYEEWFVKQFPNGGELVDVIAHKSTTADFLHWCYANLSISDIERQAYWEKLEINCIDKESIYLSDHVAESRYVSESSKVFDSAIVFSSEDVFASQNVFHSSHVGRSMQVFDSEFVYDSIRVYKGHNITESSNIVESNFIVQSSSVINSLDIMQSHYVVGLTKQTKQIENSMFITDCTNLKNCLFCSNVQDRENLLFNKPIDSARMRMIKNQLIPILDGYETVLLKGEWPEGAFNAVAPSLQRNISKQFANLPEVFWRWVATLPGYDADILYSVIFQNRLM